MEEDNRPTISEHELHGDLRVEIMRPPMRFGCALYLLAQTNAGDVTHIGHVDENGELAFTPHNAHADDVGPPTMYLSELTLAAFQKAFADLPTPADDGVRAHLADAVATRDRLLTLVETAQPRMGFLPHMPMPDAQPLWSPRDSALDNQSQGGK